MSEKRRYDLTLVVLLDGPESFVECGRLAVRVQDLADEILGEGAAAEVTVSGPSVAFGLAPAKAPR